MKILWICHFSNSQVRSKLHFSINIFETFIRFLLHKPERKKIPDFAVWITNGIVEFETFKEVELHIISPHYNMKYKTEEFELKGIHYHFFKPDDNSFFKRAGKRMLNKTDDEYKGNRKIVKTITDQIRPDIIHMYGAENPYYSICALDVDIRKYPFLVSLQTLISDIEIKTQFSASPMIYEYRSKIERNVLQKITYVGSTVTKYRNLVWQNINPNVIFLNTILAVAENTKIIKSDKVYDFVYFAASIEKAADTAIEAFALVCQKYPLSTLNIIGGASGPFKQQLSKRISELRIVKNIIFSGRLATHEDVIRQIQKSKFALLPLKTDIISSTIREAMFSGIPVLTTLTPGTPTLNINRESVLISEFGDYYAMAKNMIKLIENPQFAMKLKNNGLVTVNERYNNNAFMLQLLKVYKSIYDHHHYRKPIPIEIGTINPNKFVSQKN